MAYFCSDTFFYILLELNVQIYKEKTNQWFIFNYFILLLIYGDCILQPFCL